MNNTHTPSPWQVSPLGNVMKNSLKIANIEQMPSNNENERIANAHLISAAPDLLSTLQWFADELPEIIRQYCPEGVPIRVAHAYDAAWVAIAKAKGEV